MFEVKGCTMLHSRQRGASVNHDGVLHFIEDRTTTFTQPQTGFPSLAEPGYPS
jgi:hypothetical protein